MPSVTTVIILSLNCRCAGETAQGLQTQQHGDSRTPVALNLLHLNLNSASLLRKLFAGDKKKMCVCVCSCVHVCVSFLNVHTCVFF